MKRIIFLFIVGVLVSVYTKMPSEGAAIQVPQSTDANGNEHGDSEGD